MGKGHDLNYESAIPASFSVVVSNPSTTVVKFAITDTTGKLTSAKLIRAILLDAIAQWVAAESADLTTNGDGDLVTYQATAGDPGDGWSPWDFIYGTKSAQYTLTATTSLNVSQTLTATAPWAEVV